jgi:hypothetical protein
MTDPRAIVLLGLAGLAVGAELRRTSVGQGSRLKALPAPEWSPRVGDKVSLVIHDRSTPSGFREVVGEVVRVSAARKNTSFQVQYPDGSGEERVAWMGRKEIKPVSQGSRLKAIKVDRLSRMPMKMGPGEKVNKDRAAVEPIVFEVDLKWNLWSKDDETWASRAPLAWRNLWYGIVDGQILETGESLTIITSPSKEDRTGKVSLMPSGSSGIGIDVRIYFSIEDDVGILETITVEASEEGFNEMMNRADQIEARLIRLESGK